MQSVTCPLDSASSTPVLQGRPDYEYGVRDQLSYRRCSTCGLVFAAQIPEDKIAGFYVDYTTHGVPAPSRLGFLGRRARATTLREFDASAPLLAPGDPVLDYGCGDGSFLVELRDNRYTHLVGYDFDPKAREAARQSGAEIVEDEELLPDHGPYAVVTLNHVVEHLVDPVQVLARLGTMLRPGGRIIIRTPNARSALSRAFKDAWRGWETPRHLHVFTPAAFERLAVDPELSELRLLSIDTSQAMFMGIFHGSAHSSFWRRPSGKLIRHASAWLSFAALSALDKVFPGVGEELVVVLERSSESAQAPT